MVLVRPLPVEIPPPRVNMLWLIYLLLSESWVLVMFNIQLCQTRRFFLRSLIPLFSLHKRGRILFSAKLSMFFSLSSVS